MKTKRALPAWASQHATQENIIIADPDLFYPAILAEIAADEHPKNPPLNLKKPNRYWLEVAYQFMKMDLQFAVGTFGFTISVASGDGRKGRWNYKHHPGTDADVVRATNGLEARAHYERIRGFIPK